MNNAYELHSCVIGFKRLRRSHTAENLAAVAYHILKEFDLEGYIKCITADNASVNDSMFQILEHSYLQGMWSRKDGHVRCITHIINLAAQKILKSLKGETTVPEVLLAEAGVQEVDISLSAVLKMTRKITSKIRASNLLWEALEAQCHAVKIIPKKVFLDMRVQQVHLEIKFKFYIILIEF
jgi:hypothetical protein